MENPLMKSYHDILEIEFIDDVDRMYDKWSAELGTAFNGAMRVLCDSIEGLQKDCKPGTTFIEAALLILMMVLEEESTEENKKLNEMYKAAIAWKLKQTSTSQSTVS